MTRFGRRLGVLLGVGAAALALLSAGFLLPRRQPVPVAAYYDRLAIGMTAAEVAAAVPLRPGDQTAADSHETAAPSSEGGLPVFVDYHPHADGWVTAPHPTTGKLLRGQWWRGDDGLVYVFYDDDGRVSERRYYPGNPRSWVQSRLDRLLR